MIPSWYLGEEEEVTSRGWVSEPTPKLLMGLRVTHVF